MYTINKTFLAISVAGILVYNIPSMPVKALTTISPSSCSNDEMQLYTEGLISQYFSSVSSGNSVLIFSGCTRTFNVMKLVGFTNISIEYSSDKNNWYCEKTINDLLKSDDHSYYLNNYSISVNGGYYYRVSYTHYAKESGLFGDSQSISSISNSVWII